MINAGMVFCDRHYGGINYPVGGVGEIPVKMVNGIRQYGGLVQYKANVKEIVVEGSGEDAKAVAVKLADGRVYRYEDTVVLVNLMSFAVALPNAVRKLKLTPAPLIKPTKTKTEARPSYPTPHDGTPSKASSAKTNSPPLNKSSAPAIKNHPASFQCIWV